MIFFLSQSQASGYVCAFLIMLHLYSPRCIVSLSHRVSTNYSCITHMYGWHFHLEDVNQMFMLGW